MSPIDDELRQSLHRRAAALPPALDVFAAVEQRAHRIRRRRVAVSVTGSALAVAVIAVAIPQLVPSHPQRSTIAVLAPTATPTVAPTTVAPAPSTGPSAPVAVLSFAPRPANVLDWEARGSTPAGLLAEAEAAYATSRSATTVQPTMRLLYGGTDAAGTQYLLAQVWDIGDSVADTLGYVTHPDGTTELQLLARATKETKLLVLDVVDSPAGATETLVVVPQPRSGQLRYAADGVHYVAVPSTATAGSTTPGAAGGVVTIARDPRATNDKLELLSLDGSTLFVGGVFNLTCGLSGCG